MAVHNPDPMSPFQVGVSVRLKDSVTLKTPEGHQSFDDARIKGFLPDLADGAVFLDQPLSGTQYWNLSDLELTAEAKTAALLEVTKAMRQWIDAVPSDVVLPTMPGFDRDWADDIIALCTPAKVEGDAA